MSRNWLNRAILGKRDKSYQSWTGKHDSKKVLLKLLLTRAKNIITGFTVLLTYILVECEMRWKLIFQIGKQMLQT